MALTYGFYNAVKGDRKYDASQFSDLVDTFINDGIIPNQGQLFAVTTANNGMEINVGTGLAWFFHSWTKNDSVMVLTVKESDITRPRIDAVVLEVDRTDPVRANAIKIVSGEANVNAERPVLVNTEKVHQYPLAYITVPAAAEEIKAENIENMVGREPTVFATGVLETVPLDELWNQWEGEWDTWFAAIKLQLSGDIVTNLQLQIENKVDIADKATSADVEAGTSDDKWMTPARTKQMLQSNKVVNVDGGKVEFYKTNVPVPVHSAITLSGVSITEDDGLESTRSIDFSNFIVFVRQGTGVFHLNFNGYGRDISGDSLVWKCPSNRSKLLGFTKNSSKTTVFESFPTASNAAASKKTIYTFNFLPSTVPQPLYMPLDATSPYVVLSHSVSGSYSTTYYIGVYNKSNGSFFDWSSNVSNATPIGGYISGTTAYTVFYSSEKVVIGTQSLLDGSLSTTIIDNNGAQNIFLFYINNTSYLFTCQRRGTYNDIKYYRLSGATATLLSSVSVSFGSSGTYHYDKIHSFGVDKMLIHGAPILNSTPIFILTQSNLISYSINLNLIDTNRDRINCVGAFGKYVLLRSLDKVCYGVNYLTGDSIQLPTYGPDSKIIAGGETLLGITDMLHNCTIHHIDYTVGGFKKVGS